MTETEREMIRNVILGYKEMRKWRSEQCSEIRKIYDKGEITVQQFNDRIDLVFESYFETEQVTKYRKLQKIAQKNHVIQEEIDRIYREVWPNNPYIY